MKTKIKNKIIITTPKTKKINNNNNHNINNINNNKNVYVTFKFNYYDFLDIVSLL
jgi:hypothetical protein